MTDIIDFAARKAAADRAADQLLYEQWVATFPDELKQVLLRVSENPPTFDTRTVCRAELVAVVSALDALVLLGLALKATDGPNASYRVTPRGQEYCEIFRKAAAGGVPPRGAA